MKLTDITNSVKGFVSNTSWKIEKHAPEILLVTGIVSTVAAVAMAVKATPKAAAIIEEHKTKMEIVHKCAEVGMRGDTETGENVPYTEDDKKKDTIHYYATTSLKLAKEFAPATILLGVSIASQVCGYKVLSRRLAEASAAYALLASKFKAYRKRVADKYGIDEEKAIYHNLRDKEISTATVDADGNVIEGCETVKVTDDDDFTMVFSQFNRKGVLNTNWFNSTEQCLTFLQMEQAYWNNVLKLRKGAPVYLNEIRARLAGDTERTCLGQVVGWTYEPDNPNHHGDNFIDFGIDRIIKAYRDGEEMPDDNSFVLEFNVDGDVLYAA